MKLLLKNSAGRPDGMFTFAFFMVMIVGSKVLLSSIVVAIGASKSIAFGPAPDAGTITAMLTPTLGAYVMRRNRIGSHPSVVTEEAK